MVSKRDESKVLAYYLTWFISKYCKEPARIIQYNSSIFVHKTYKKRLSPYRWIKILTIKTPIMKNNFCTYCISKKCHFHSILTISIMTSLLGNAVRTWGSLMFSRKHQTLSRLSSRFPSNLNMDLLCDTISCRNSSAGKNIMRLSF